VRSALLHVVALAQYASVYTRSWAAESCNTRVRLRATVDQLQQGVALLLFLVAAVVQWEHLVFDALPAKHMGELGDPNLTRIAFGEALDGSAAHQTGGQEAPLFAESPAGRPPELRRERGRQQGHGRRPEGCASLAAT
jgi:hypothetical protein